MEELDSLEETLNDSIRESNGVCAGRSFGGRTKAFTEEEENTVRYASTFFSFNFIYFFLKIVDGGHVCG